MRPGSTSSTGTSSTRHPRGEQGIALIVALLSIMLMTALGMALMLTSQTETLISANYRDSMEGEYVADAGIERVMDDVLTIPDWNALLTSPDGVTAGVTSGFHDNAPSSPITLPDGRTLNLAKRDQHDQLREDDDVYRQRHEHVHATTGRGATTTRASASTPGGRSTI